MTNLCPCGSKQSFEKCCGQYINGNKAAPSAEALMRSRYTAYTLGDIDYIQKTLDGPAAKNFDPIRAKEWATASRWLGLEVIHHQVISNNHAYVEFMAHYEIDKQMQCLHEVSEFRRIQGQWFYIDGETPIIARNPRRKQEKVGRNAPCPCGSGRKYKHCCGLNN